MAFHAALRSAHLSFLSHLDDNTRQLLRQHLDASTSEFAMNLMASLPDMMYPDEEGGVGYEEGEQATVQHGDTDAQVRFRGWGGDAGWGRGRGGGGQ